MNIKCSHKDLLHALSTVSRVVSTRTALPVLGNILLETDDGRLKVSATNMTTHISVWIDAKARREGAITVPAKTLHDLIRTMSNGVVQLLLNNKKQTLRVKADNFVNNLKGISPDEFPLPKSGETGALVVADALRHAIDQTVFAAATSENRPILSGVLMHFDSDTLLLAAADGFRLSECSVPLATAIREPIDVIVPRSTIVELRRVLGTRENSVGVAFSEQHQNVMFDLDDIQVVTQILSGKFPDYRKIIPATYATQVIVENEELHRACKVVRVFAHENDAKAMHLVIPQDEGGGIVVEATSAETGDGVVMVDAEVAGESLEIGLNTDFLLEALSVMSGKIELQFTGATNPCLLRMNEDSDPFVHVIMPVHVEGSDGEAGA